MLKFFISDLQNGIGLRRWGSASKDGKWGIRRVRGWRCAIELEVGGLGGTSGGGAGEIEQAG